MYLYIWIYLDVRVLVHILLEVLRVTCAGNFLLPWHVSVVIMIGLFFIMSVSPPL